jgi:hypothetical protein
MTDSAPDHPHDAEWRRRHALRCAMQAWADDICEQIDMCAELEEHPSSLPDGVMRRVHERRSWYLAPDDSYASLEAYTDATYAALTAYVRVYLPAEEAGRRKRRRAPRGAQGRAHRGRARLPARGRRRGGRATQAPARAARSSRPSAPPNPRARARAPRIAPASARSAHTERASMHARRPLSFLIESGQMNARVLRKGPIRAYAHLKPPRSL